MPLTKKKEIAATVDAIAAEFQPKVRRIRWEIGKDWYGDPALFLRILLADSATKGRRLALIANAVQRQIHDKLTPDEFGLYPYCSFRSESEQEELQDKDWA